jgi:hypothetical protein
MMHYFRGGVASLVALCATVGFARQTDGGLAGLRAVQTGNLAYLVGEPEAVAGPGVAQVLAAPRGRYALLLREKPDIAPGIALPGENPGRIEQNLIVWDARNRRASVVWRRTISGNAGNGVQLHAFLPGTMAAVATVETAPSGTDTVGNTALALVDVVSGTVRSIPVPPAEILRADVSPTEARVAAIAQKIERNEAGMSVQSTLHFVGDRRVLATVPLTDGMKPIGWRADGTYLLAQRTPAQSRFHKVDPQTGAVVPVDTPDLPKEASAAPGPLALRRGRATVKEAERTASVQALWLEATEPARPDGTLRRVLLTTQSTEYGDPGVVLADLSAVLFRAGSTVLAAPLRALDAAGLLALRRQDAMDRAKQVGLALMMYAQDYDENLPPPGSSLTDLVDPYLRNADLLKNFQFTYNGPTEFGKIATPSDTVLGYYPGPDGSRVTIFADGHVRWDGS